MAAAQQSQRRIGGRKGGRSGGGRRRGGGRDDCLQLVHQCTVGEQHGDRWKEDHSGDLSFYVMQLHTEVMSTEYFSVCGLLY